MADTHLHAHMTGLSGGHRLGSRSSGGGRSMGCRGWKGGRC